MSNQITKGFGDTKFGGATFIKTGKVIKGENFIRILPPLGNLAETGEWRKYYTTHWGWSGVNSRDTTKHVARPFRCILDKDRRTGIVRRECPACTQQEVRIAKAKEYEAQLRARGMDEDEIKTAMEETNKEVQDFRAESKWYVNVVYKDGKVGDFKLNHKDHMSRIMTLIEGTQDNPKAGLLKGEGVHPFAPDQGVWFKITRTGNGVQPPDSVEVEQEFVDPTNPRKGKVTLLAPLCDEIAEKALTECRSLDTLGGYVLTPEQISALVQCSGDPEEVDRIFGAVLVKAKADAPVVPEAPSENVQEFKVNGKVVSKADYDRYQVVMAKKKAEADLKAKAEAEARAKAEAEAAANAPVDGTADAPALDLKDVSDEDFLKRLG
jgi:hypothetical protein